MRVRVPQSYEDLTKHLTEQIQFLRLSSDAYDKGFEGEAKRLAVIIRILVHDTKNSVSLLTSLGVKKSFDFYTLLKPVDEKKTVGYVGLSMGFDEKGFRYFPMLQQPIEKMNFNEWWSQVVILNKNQGVRFGRKDIVLSVADMDGGAHVDPDIDKAYAELSRNNSFGWEVLRGNGKQGIVENGPELPIVRQIAHEIYCTLLDYLEPGYRISNSVSKNANFSNFQISKPSDGCVRNDDKRKEAEIVTVSIIGIGAESNPFRPDTDAKCWECISENKDGTMTIRILD